MVTKINECLLNGQDYLFMAQSLAINDLNIEIERASTNLMLGLFADVALSIPIVLMVFLAVTIRSRIKGGSNLLLATVAIGLIVMVSMTYQQFTKKNALQKEVEAKVIVINDLAKPDPELFAACIEPTALLKKLPDSDGKSSYKQVISTNSY